MGGCLCVIILWVVGSGMFHCTCIYSTCSFLDCHDFVVDYVQHCELINV